MAGSQHGVGPHCLPLAPEGRMQPGRKPSCQLGTTDQAFTRLLSLHCKAGDWSEDTCLCSIGVEVGGDS